MQRVLPPNLQEDLDLAASLGIMKYDKSDEIISQCQRCLNEQRADAERWQTLALEFRRGLRHAQRYLRFIDNWLRPGAHDAVRLHERIQELQAQAQDAEQLQQQVRQLQRQVARQQQQLDDAADEHYAMEVQARRESDRREVTMRRQEEQQHRIQYLENQLDRMADTVDQLSSLLGRLPVYRPARW